MNLSDSEKCHFRKQFSMTLANLSQVAIYWSPSARSVIARGVGSSRCPRALPLDAIFVGNYAHPFSGNDFLGDLDDVIEKAKRSERPSDDDSLAFVI